MSEIAVTWAKAQTCTSARAKDVLKGIASWANAHGEGWVHVSILAFEMQKDERTVQRGLAELRKGDPVKGIRPLLLSTGRFEVYDGKRVPIFRLPLETGPANTLIARREQIAAEQAARDAENSELGVTPVSPQGAVLGVTVVSPQAAIEDLWGDSGVTPRGDTGVTLIGKEIGKIESPSSILPADEVEEAGNRFAQAIELWPEEGIERTRFAAARALWAEAVAEVGAVELLASIGRYLAGDRMLRVGDHGAPGLHNWLGQERWRAWLGGRADGAEAEPAIAGPSWAGPAALRRAFVVHFGEGRTAAYLDRATWREADRVVIPATGVAFDFFNRDARWLLREQDVRLVAPDAAGQVQA